MDHQIAAAGDFLTGLLRWIRNWRKKSVWEAARVAGFCIGLTSVGSRQRTAESAGGVLVIVSASAATGRAAARVTPYPRCGFSVARCTCMP